MLTPEQLDQQAENTTRALIALDEDMRLVMVRHLQKLNSLDATEANKSAVALQNELRQTIKKHDAEIQRAILLDVSASNILNITSELEALQSYAGR